MTRKERILNFLEKLPDDVSFDRVIYHAGVMREIEAGIAEADRGEGVDHDELFRRLLKKYDQSQPLLDAAGRKKSRRNSGRNSTRQTSGRRSLRQGA